MPAELLKTLAELTERSGSDTRRTRHIDVGPGASHKLATWLGTHRSAGTPWVVCDPNTLAAAGQGVVERLRGAGHDPQLVILAPEGGEAELVCDDHAIASLARRVDEASALGDIHLIAVGAGTINDIVKMVAFKQSKSYVCVPTAASMNGYTSAIGAVLSRGVKRTLAAQQPEAIFADTEIIARAPAHLNRSGFGDLLSKPYSTADWWLSHAIRGIAFHEEPSELLDPAYELLLTHAPSVGEGAPEGIDVLTQTLLISGFTMALAGSSAPASGGEHLVSHYWDMEQHSRELPLLGLHGTQVGIATLLYAHLYDWLVATDIETLDLEAAHRRFATDAWLRDLPQLHSRLPPAIVAEVEAQIRAKQRHGDEHRAELDLVRDRWPAIRIGLAARIKPTRRIAKALNEAHAASRPSDIGCDFGRAVQTLRVCRHIRDRYVALDLLDDLGLLPSWSEAALHAVELGSSSSPA